MDTSANVIKKVAKLSIKLPASSIQHHQVNVLMFGPSGHGKSSTGNSMLGKKEFPVSCDGESETTEFMSKFTDFEQYRVKIVDSPPAPRVNPQHNNNILKYCGSFIPQIAKRFPKGCHAPVLVLRFGNRFESHDEFSVTMLKEMFGEKFIFEHCVCVVTHGDMFNKVMAEGQTGRSLYDWCRDQKGVLEKIFKAVNYRCVLFDNFGDLDTKKEQMHQLMHLIVDSWPQAMDIVSVSPQMRILADIHTLLESAPSFDDYQKQLQFLVSYTGSYNIGSRQVQISVMIFGTSQHLRFDFTEFSSHDEFARKILSAPYLGASSGTDTALALARQESFGPDSGSRPGVKQMALMITEGRSKDESKTAEEAAQLKDSGTQIMVIGVASVDRKTVECLASDPEDVFIAEDYEELEQEIPKIAKQRTCVVAPEFKSTADILFILDSSGSISPEDFQKELAFVVNLTEAFNIGIGAVRFGAMVFSNSPQIVYDFKFTNHEEIKRATYRSPHFRGSTNTADALDLARTTAFTAEGGTRDDKKIAIVITDGVSNDIKQTAKAAEKLTDSGVLTLAIGVGNINILELQLIASLDGDVYTVDNYDVIQTIQDEIAGRTSKLENVTHKSRRSMYSNGPRPASPSFTPTASPHRPYNSSQQNPNTRDACAIL